MLRRPPCIGRASRPGGDQVAASRAGPRRRWPATAPARCRRARCCSQFSTASTPSRRFCWLGGLSNANGGLNTLASTADRPASVAGQTARPGGVGTRPSAAAPADCPARRAGRRAPPAADRRAAWESPPAVGGGHARPRRTTSAGSPAGIPPPAARPGPASRCRAWKASTARDHVLGHRVQIPLGGRQVGVPEHPLHVGQRHLRVPRHPIRRRMPKIVQRPVRPQRGVGPGEHRPGRVIGQRPQRFPQRPPQRLVPAGRHQTVPAAPDTAAATRTHPATPATAATPGCPSASP